MRFFDALPAGFLKYSFIVLAFFVYTFFLLFCYSKIGIDAVVLLIAMVAITSFFYGKKVGVIFGIIFVPLEILLLGWYANAWVEIEQSVVNAWGVVGYVATILIALIFGSLHDMRVCLEQEILKRERIENDLLKRCDQAKDEVSSGPENFVALGKVASFLAPELRNVLDCVKISITSLKEKIGRKSEIVKHLENISKNISEADTVTQNLFVLARVPQSTSETSSLDDAIEKALLRVQGRADQLGVTIIKKMDPAMVLISADFNLLVEMFDRLFLNAVQSMEDSKLKRLTIRTKRNGNIANIEIIDTGCGIAPEDIDKLGANFYSTKNKEIGLGIHVAREIIKKHGGEISVASEKGVGSVFMLDLPIRQ